jgi:hypothetical protein
LEPEPDQQAQAHAHYASGIIHELNSEPALALEEYLRRHQSLQLLERINRAYRDAPDATEQERLRKTRRQHRKIVEGTW